MVSLPADCPILSTSLSNPCRFCRGKGSKGVSSISRCLQHASPREETHYAFAMMPLGPSLVSQARQTILVFAVATSRSYLPWKLGTLMKHESSLYPSEVNLIFSHLKEHCFLFFRLFQASKHHLFLLLQKHL